MGQFVGGGPALATAQTTCGPLNGGGPVRVTPPGVGNCDRKLMSYYWAVPVNSGANWWRLVALGAEEAVRRQQENYR